MTFGTERYLGKVRTYVLICNNFEGLRGKSQNRHTRIKYRKTGIRREAAASNYFHEIFGQDLLSKKWVLLRLLFEGGFYLRAASNTGFTVCRFQKLFAFSQT